MTYLTHLDARSARCLRALLGVLLRIDPRNVPRGIGEGFPCLRRGLTKTTLGWVLSVACVGQTSHAQTDLSDTAEPSGSRGDIQALIQQLGAERFSDRERATNELIRAGTLAVDGLQQAMADRDREVRRRAEQAIIEIAKLDRPRRLAMFRRGSLEAAEPTTPLFGIPGIQLMFSIAGDTTDSRKLLTRALQRDWDFCEAVAQSTPQAERLIDAKCATLRMRPYTSTRESTSPGDVIAILLGAISNPGATSDATAIQIYSLISQLEYSDPHQDEHKELWSSPAFRRLLGEFIGCCEGPTATYQGLNLSLRFNLPEGLPAAERVLRDEQSLPFVRQYAILTIARFGNGSHLADLHRLINDNQVCFTRRTTLRNSNFECQIRDLALASMLHLLGRDPRQFGFVHLQRSNNYVFQPHTVGFDTDQDRKLALLQFQLLTVVTGLP